jgi:hypothetical protein
MGAALQSGKTSEPTLMKFFREQSWWQRLGVRMDPRPLHDRPAPEVRGYELIMTELARRERKSSNEQHQRPVYPGGGL